MILFAIGLGANGDFRHSGKSAEKMPVTSDIILGYV
jgi:hypothetical protein